MAPVVAFAAEPDPVVLDTNNAAQMSQFVCPDSTEIYTEGDLCVKDSERKEYSVSIMEEGFGKAYKIEEDGKTISEVRTCYRVTKPVECKNKDSNSAIESIDKNFTGLTKTCPSGEGVTCQKVTVLLGKGGVSLIQLYVGMIYRWAATMAGIVCVLIMIVSGIQISASGGDTTGMDAARKRITQSLMALAVLFLSAVILYMINPNFFTR